MNCHMRRQLMHGIQVRYEHGLIDNPHCAASERKGANCGISFSIRAKEKQMRSKNIKGMEDDLPCRD